MRKLHAMRKFIFLLLLGCLSEINAQTDYNYIYQNDSIIQKGIALYSKEKYKDAIKEYDRISKSDPKFLEAQYEKALALSAIDSIKDTRAFLENLYTSNQMQEFPTLYTVYASFLSDQKEYEKSEKVFKEAEKYLSNSSNFLYNLAILYIRKEERQKSIELLKQIITIDPNFASAHYLLGLMAFEDGRITEGTLAMMSYLVIAPEGRYAENAILKLNAKYGQNFLDKSKLTFSKSGDQYEEIETILRNQLPLKSAYKVKSEIDDVITRQIQAVAEYTVDHKIGDGFFETTYMPWIKDMMEKKQFEGLSYYILLSMEEKLGKKYISQKKKIVSFYENYLLAHFWGTFTKRKIDLFGKMEEVNILYKNNAPYLIGNVVNSKKEGKFKYLNESGNLRGELNYKNNELNGLQKYYDDKGILTEEKTFINGNLDGTKTTYFTNGATSITENYKEGVLEGLAATYYVNGGKQYEVNFSEGERDGKFIGLFPNGSKKMESNYTKGKLNGAYSKYNEAGDLIESCNYIDDAIDGKYIEYYDGKLLKTESLYAKGVVQGNTKTYHSNGVLERENVYVAGKINKSTEYYPNGKKQWEYLYNEKGELEKIISYDANENKYFEEIYKAGEIKSGIQYTRNNPNPEALSTSKKPFKISNLDGQPLAVGNYEKGKKVGEWNYYYSSGRLRMKENFIKGNQNGLAYAYKRNGELDAIRNYVNDTINGLYEVYENNKINRTFNYINGKQFGPFKTFYPDGTMSAEGNLSNGDVVETKLSYWQNGNVYYKDFYIEDELTSSQLFNSKGEKDFYIDYKNRTGNFNLSFYNGVFTQNYTMINGKRNGKVTIKDKLNTPILESEYINGVRHNRLKSYSPLGTLESDKTYYCGEIHGTETEYDMVGNLRLVDEQFFGEEHGKTTRYYYNKAKAVEYFEMDSDLYGEYKYFNHSGELILILNYENNAIKSYTTFGKTGLVDEKHEVKDGTASIVSRYPNGKKAIEMNFVKENIEGKLMIYSKEEKPEFESNYIHNSLNGDRIDYYTNGNIYKKERFKDGSHDGAQEYFKEDGKKWLTAEYKNEELHGNTYIYTNGILTLTKKYDSNELVEIIK